MKKCSLMCPQVHSVHTPEAVPSDDSGLRRLFQYHSGSSDGVPDLSGRECAVQGLAAIDQEVSEGRERRKALRHLGSRFSFLITLKNLYFLDFLLLFIIRSKSCKKDLWTQINATLNNSK